MSRFLHLLTYIDKLSEWGGKVGAVLILASVAIIVYEVTVRYFFASPTNWAHELSEMLYGSFTVLGGALVLRYRGHIRMDVLYLRLSPRKRLILELIAIPFIFLVCGVLLWHSLGRGMISLSMMQHSGTSWDPPVYPLKMLIFVSIALLSLQALAQFVRDLTSFLKDEDILWK